MSGPADRRSLAANGRVALASLRGQVAAERFTEGEVLRCAVALTDLCRAPGGVRDKQLLRGQPFRVLELRDGWAFGRDETDGYVGYLRADALAAGVTPTHRVAARACHVYSAPDIKAPEIESLSFLSLLAVTGEAGRFLALAEGGFVPAVQLARAAAAESDPVAVAERFLGTPYLWGGNSAFGIDCSGLVQLALRACGAPCPRDSDQQQRALGRPLPAGAPLRRGDLVFWAGHVGMMTDAERIVHANAHHMAVVREPLAVARARIEAAGGGPVAEVRRLG